MWENICGPVWTVPSVWWILPLEHECVCTHTFQSKMCFHYPAGVCWSSLGCVSAYCICVCMHVHVGNCVCVSVCTSPQPLPSITPQHSLSLHQHCHKIMWQGVSHVGAWGTMATRGVLAEHFCEQHQERGNSRDQSTEGINLTAARSHTLPPSFPSGHTIHPNPPSSLTPDPWKKEPGGSHMQIKCSAMPWESHS